MRPCPEFYGSDARRTPAAAPQLLDLRHTAVSRLVAEGADAALYAELAAPPRAARA
jgi:hypothetical protein